MSLVYSPLPCRLLPRLTALARPTSFSRLASDEAAPYRRRALYVRHISLRDYDCNLAAWMIQGIGPGAFTGLRSFALPLWTSSRELWGNHMPAPVPLQGIEVVRLFSSVPILRICVNSRPINSTSFSDWTAAAPTEVHVAFARPRLDQQSLPMTFLPDLLGFQPALERLVIITARGDDNQRSFRTRVAPATYARDLCSLLRPLLTDSDVSVGRHTSGMNQRYRLAPICRLSPKSSFRSPITSRDYSRRVLGSQLPSIGALLTTRYQCRWRELSFSSIWSNRSCRRADEASASVLSLPIAADFSRTTTDSSEDVDSIDNAGSGFPNEY